MDVRAIRTGLAEQLTIVLNPAGWQVFDTEPGDVALLPAAVVGVPDTITYHVTGALGRVTLPLVLATSLADETDAQHRLDEALSTGIPGSVVDLLTSMVRSDAWRGHPRVVSAGNIREVSVGQGRALAADITLELLA